MLRINQERNRWRLIFETMPEYRIVWRQTVGQVTASEEEEEEEEEEEDDGEKKKLIRDHLP